MASMNRRDFRRTALARLKDARALLKARCWSGAYYVGGYAVECALKACIARQIKAGDWPPTAEATRNGYYSHDLKVLLKTAGLEADQKARAQNSQSFATNWQTVTGWNEQRRYETAISSQQAMDFIRAIEDPVDGILVWLRVHW